MTKLRGQVIAKHEASAVRAIKKKSEGDSSGSYSASGFQVTAKQILSAVRSLRA